MWWRPGGWAGHGRIALATSGGESRIGLRIDPTDPAFTHASAVARCSYGLRNSITGCEVLAPSIGPFRVATVLHELGHALGLGHSPEPSDIMSFIDLASKDFAFTERERVTIALVHQRLSGQTQPDNDQILGVEASTLEAGIFVIYD
jgi:hypothetical protein